MQAPPPPIVVKVVESDPAIGLRDVILNAIGLTGVIVLIALLLGLVLAGAVIGFRRMRAARITDEEAAQTQSLGLTPHS